MGALKIIRILEKEISIGMKFLGVSNIKALSPDMVCWCTTYDSFLYLSIGGKAWIQCKTISIIAPEKYISRFAIYTKIDDRAGSPELRSVLKQI